MEIMVRAKCDKCFGHGTIFDPYPIEGRKIENVVCPKCKGTGRIEGWKRYRNLNALVEDMKEDDR